jgi:pilus assembly protein CpaB
MRRPIGFALLAALAATLAAVVVYSALRRRETEMQKVSASMVDIVVAARDLPIGSKIEPGAVKLARWSRDSLPAGAATDPQSLMGGIVKDRFAENEPVIATRLATGEKDAGAMPLLIPPGMRAMSVAVDEVSDVAGFILPGAKVDVLVSFLRGDKAFSKLMLENIAVLAVAQQIDNEKDTPQLVKVVTLLVTPEEAERLALAAQQGALRLALRGYTDNKIVLTAGSNTENMLQSYSNGAPLSVAPSQLPIAGARGQLPIAPGQAPPSSRADVEIMRGGKRREIISFLKGVRSTPPSPAGQEPPSGPSPSDGPPAGESTSFSAGNQAAHGPADATSQSALQSPAPEPQRDPAQNAASDTAASDTRGEPAP